MSDDRYCFISFRKTRRKKLQTTKTKEEHIKMCEITIINRRFDGCSQNFETWKKRRCRRRKQSLKMLFSNVFVQIIKIKQHSPFLFITSKRKKTFILFLRVVSVVVVQEQLTHEYGVNFSSTVK